MTRCQNIHIVCSETFGKRVVSTIFFEMHGQVFLQQKRVQSTSNNNS